MATQKQETKIVVNMEKLLKPKTAGHCGEPE